MQSTEVINRVKKRRQSYTYFTGMEWLGNKVGRLSSNGKPKLRISSPPEFKGEDGVWTPEHMFVAAVESCTMATFLVFAEKLNLPIVSYTSDSEGLLDFTGSGYQFVKIIVRPIVTVESQAAIPKVEKALHDAHSKCLISNSISAETILEPRVGTFEKT